MKIPNNIRRIVTLRQMLRAWCIKATSSSSFRRLPPDVPPGHVAICVGSSCRRFIVRAKHLNHPIFRQLLRQVEEECGFSNNPGPLVIPCEESLFEQILRLISTGDSANSDLKRCGRDENSLCLFESRPLLYGFTA